MARSAVRRNTSQDRYGMQIWRPTLLGIVVALLVALVSTPVGAQDFPPSISVTSDEYEIVTSDDGTSSLTVTLLVSEVVDPTGVSLLIPGIDPKDCVPLQQPILRPGVQTEVEFELPATCKISGPVIIEFATYAYDPSAGTPSGVAVPVSVGEENTPSPEYTDLLIGFGAAAALAIAVMLMSALAWGDQKNSAPQLAKRVKKIKKRLARSESLERMAVVSGMAVAPSTTTDKDEARVPSVTKSLEDMTVALETMTDEDEDETRSWKQRNKGLAGLIRANRAETTTLTTAQLKRSAGDLEQDADDLSKSIEALGSSGKAEKQLTKLVADVKDLAKAAHKGSLPPTWPPGPGRLLPGLGSKWSWEDSPLSNVTVAAAVFTALLGASDILESVLGDSGVSEVAVVVVAAALTTALVAAAPLVISVLRKEPPYFDESNAPNNYTVIGVVMATLVTLVGNLGLIITIIITLWDSDSIDRNTMLFAAGIVGAFVCIYTARSMRRTIKIGLVGELPLTPTEEKAAELPPTAVVPGLSAMP